jgi:hypothetical protein
VIFGESTLLDISVLPLRPEADDWAFVFAGRNTLTSLRGQPGAPWRLAEADALWKLNRDEAVPMGYWGRQSSLGIFDTREQRYGA